VAELIDTPEALARALETLRPHARLAVDTESDSYYAYRPKVCLIQVSVPGADFLLDPLARLDLSPFGALLGDPEREMVFHAAENDVIQLGHQFDWHIASLFDTQVACFVLGLKPYSLAGILEARFGVKLDKSQQRSDWARRPLETAQIAYAAEDTAHLLDLAAELKDRARQAGREEEIAYECRRIAGRTWQPEPFDPEGFRRMAGARELGGVELRILRDLFLMRNEEAERRDRAPYRVAHDHVLVHIARNRSRQPGRGVPPAFWRRYGARVSGIVDAAAKEGPLPPRRRETRRGEPLDPVVKARFEKLRRWRNEAAQERGVEMWVVARNELLLEVAQRAPGSRDELGELLEPFRLAEYGDAILEAIA